MGNKKAEANFGIVERSVDQVLNDDSITEDDEEFQRRERELERMDEEWDEC